MKRPAALAFAFALSASILWLPRPGAAQGPPVRLTLLEKTPWSSPQEPDVTLRVRAENLGDQSVGELSLGLTLWGPVTSRSGFEASLVGDPPGGIQLLARPLPREGVLVPDEVRVFETTLTLPLDRLDPTRSLIYPLTVDLRSGFTSVVALRTSVIFLVREPQTPLNLSWTFVLSAPLLTGPDGVFGSSSLETSIAAGGRLAGEVAALAETVQAGVAVDVVVSPLLLRQLVEMRDGYTVEEFGQVRKVAEGDGGAAAAGELLAALREVAATPNVELSALPLAAPHLPALAAGGLVRDLEVQLALGRDLTSEVLGRAPDASVLRPPGSALDQASLNELSRQGIGLLLLDPVTAPPPEQELGFAPPPAVALAAEDATVTALVSDASVQALLTSTLPTEDPVRAAHAALGELAAIWLERPGEERGVAVILPEQLSAPGPFFGALARAVARAPWLAKRSATALAQSFPPGEEVTPLVASGGGFSQVYVEALKQARSRIETYRSMLVEPSEQPGALETLLLLAESRQFVGDETAGSAFMQQVRTTADALFDAVRPDPNQVFTLTSSARNRIPVRVTSEAEVPVRVTVRLVSRYLRETVEQSTVLEPGTTQTLTFDLELRTTGRRDVVVQVLSPSGREISRSTLVVRSTAYNRIALVITVGAALLALLIWARRFVPRPTT